MGWQDTAGGIVTVIRATFYHLSVTVSTKVLVLLRLTLLNVRDDSIRPEFRPAHHMIPGIRPKLISPPLNTA
jgi:hypothetical protein